MSTSNQPLPSSYRDPAGFIFRSEGRIYRQVNKCYQQDYEHLMSSGLYATLVEKKLLLPHRETARNSDDGDAWLTLEPELIPFISYPWEWSFDMLKDAALLTLRLVKESLKYGMILKDASAFNIQFTDGSPVFIDTLSFERYDPSVPWVAYRQYCESFLGPLLLMHYSNQSLPQLMLAWPEGIPPEVSKSLLPWRSRFSLHVWLHIHLHAKVSGRKPSNTAAGKFSEKKLSNLLTSLEIITGKTKLPAQQTTWSAYYDEASKREDYLEIKKQVVIGWIKESAPLTTAIDLGANDGSLSEAVSSEGIFTIAADFDPLAINNLYRRIKDKNIIRLQPLVIDLSVPSPAIGFENLERDSFTERVHADLGIALALIHHLAIGRNIPLHRIAKYFSRLCRLLIIEFVPKDDVMIRKMLEGKKDIYTGYHQQEFERSFSAFFQIEKTAPAGNSGRTLYKMKRIQQET